MRTDLDEQIRTELAAMADSLGDVRVPDALPASVVRAQELPVNARARSLSWILGAVAASGLAVAGLALWTRDAPSSTRVATEVEGPSFVPTTVAETAETATTTTDDPGAPDGTWRPPRPHFRETLLRFDPAGVPAGALPDGQHFGILDRVGESGGSPAVRFSRGDQLRGEQADQVRAELIAALGVGTEPDHELAIGHPWWTPESGPGWYVYPDFDLPVSLPVNLEQLTVVVTNHDGPLGVRFQDLLDHADGLGDLPHNWTGLVTITVTDGQITHIDSPFHP